MLPTRTPVATQALWLLLSLYLLVPGAAAATNVGRAPLKVEIEGLSGALLANVQAWLGIDQPGPLQRLQGLFKIHGQASDQTEAQVQRFYRDAPGRIRQALRALGHYNPAIHPTLERRHDRWLIRLRIDPGPATTIASTDIRVEGPGQTLPVLQKWLKAFPLRTGRVLNDGVWEQAKQQGLGLARGHGYLDARYRLHRITVDPVRNSARLSLVLVSGERYRFGPVTFEQQPHVLDNAFLQRYVTFRAGTPVNSKALGDFEANLLNSGYFANVQLSQHKGDQHSLPIQVQLTPAKRYALSTGIGYGTDTGPRAHLTWRDRRVNPRGHTLTASLNLSTLLQGAALSYAIPLANPVQDSLALGSSLQRTDTNISLSTIAQLSATWTHRMGNGWTRKLSTALNGERYQIAGQTTRSLSLVPGVDFSRTWSQGDPLMPRRGWHLDLKLQTGVPLSNSTPFLQGLVKAKWIDTLGDSRIRVLLHGALGATLVQNFDRLPASDRFFTGGADSLRGFRYNTVGPRDSSGQVTGGSYLAVGGIELQYPLLRNWSLGVFTDAGNVGRNLSDMRAAITSGVGVRWHSPVGPIRLYLARRLTGQGETYPLVISMGPDL